ncbi:hypothetical protein JCM8097_008549 [Rhodosporidiobolus ruineniae]
MQALLLSPATTFSPDSSSDSLGSPSTPPPPSLDFLDSPTSPTQGQTQQLDTPTRPRPRSTPPPQPGAAQDALATPSTPSWLSDALAEEWVEQPSDSSATLQAHSHDTTDNTVVPPSANATPRPPPPPPSSLLHATAYNSLPRNTAPRVPSSLRHAFTASVASTSATDLTGPTDRSAVQSEAEEEDDGEGTSVLDFDSIRGRPGGGTGGGDASVYLLGSSLPPSGGMYADQTFGAGEYSAQDDSHVDLEPRVADDEVEDGEPEEDASTGSCVVNSVVERSGSGGAGGTQLRAAVQALRGPQGGIFGGEDGEEEQEEGQPVDKGKGKAKGGLMSLFEPPSPEGEASASNPLPQSSLPSGPTLTSFTFSPPSPHAPSPASPVSPHANGTGGTSRWKDLMHFTPSPPPRPSVPPSSTPPHETPTGQHGYLAGFDFSIDDRTPLARSSSSPYRPAQPSFATPSAAASATPSATPTATGRARKPALVSHGAAAAAPGPVPPSGPARKERFLHRSTSNRPLASSVSAPPLVADQEEQEQEPRYEHDEEYADEDEEEEEDSEDIPFVPPPVPAGEHLSSEDMSTTSGSSSDEDDEDEDEEETEQRSTVQRSFSVVDEEDGFTSESEREDEGVRPTPVRAPQRDLLEPSWLSEGQELEGSVVEQDEQDEQDEHDDDESELPSRSLSALPSPPSHSGQPIFDFSASPSSHPHLPRAELSHISEVAEEDQSSYRFPHGLSSRSTLAPPLPSPGTYPSAAGLRTPDSSLPPLPKSPARIPIPSPLLNPPSSSQSARSAARSPAAPPPASPYKLFQPQYDTLTRTHLLSLVDEIDSLSSSTSARSNNLLHGAPEPPRLPSTPEEEAQEGQEEQEDREAETSEEGFLGLEGAARSSKRIKLSPRTEFSARFSGAGDHSAVEDRTPLRPRQLRSGRAGTPPSTGALNSAASRHRRSAAVSSSARRPGLRRQSPLSARRAALRSSGLSSLPSLPPPLSPDDGSFVSTPGSQRSARSAALQEREQEEELEASLAASRSARSRQRIDEANAVMERIRGLVDKRERRRLGETTESQQTTPRPSRTRSPLKRLSPSADTDVEAPPSPAAQTDSPPPLPHLAAAASASLRATLGSPAPISPSLGASFPSPALGSGSLRLRSSGPAAQKDAMGSIGRRRFARTPVGVGASGKKREGKKDGKEKGGLWAMTKGVRGLFGTEEDDLELQRQEEEGEKENQDEAEEGDEEQEQEEERDDVPSLPTLPSITSTNLSTPSAPLSSSAARRSTSGHARQSSLTTLHPTAPHTQRLLASAGASAREKGLVFDQEMQRWIRTPRRSVLGSSQEGDEGIAAASTAQVEQEQAVEEQDDEEEDPFRDFSELRSSHSIKASSPKAASIISPHSLDLDALPRAGDGSGSGSNSLQRNVADVVDLSGLGITKGTPPSLVPFAPAQPAPLPLPNGLDTPDDPSRSYFSPPPPEARPADEGPDGPDLVLESEDSATWGRGDGQRERRRKETEKLFEPRRDGEGDGVVLDEAETSMLSLYRAAHTAPTSQAEVEDETTRSSTPAALSSTRPPTASDSSAYSPFERTPAKPTPSSTAPRSVPPPPRSAMKQPIRSQSDPVATVSSTPLRTFAVDAKVPRSVSFSDGKTSGKIEGLVALEPYRPSPLAARGTAFGGSEEDDSTVESLVEGPGELEFDEQYGRNNEDEEADRTVTQDGFVGAELASARTKRIGTALDDLAQGPDESPFSGRFARSSAQAASFSFRNRSLARTTSAPAGGNVGNATFLTECSFGVSHDRLLQYITDVEPFEPDWEGLRSIDLSGKKAESVVRMKEFLPSLDEVNLNTNELTYLTGIPSTLRTLLVASNRLTSLTSFQHLIRLERLDLSNNQLDSVQQLACLVHLRELKANGNRISDLAGLDGLDSLVKVSLKGNALEEVDFGKTKWSRLETLHLARNQISVVRNLDKLASLSTLNLDHNLLTSLDPAAEMPRLRVLRLCSNPLTGLDVAFAPRLRTLYVDSAKLGLVQGTEQLRKLENLSVRDQSGGALTLSMPHIRDVKRLYLSGNPLPTSFPSEKFFNLVYLELAMCQLTSLPTNLASVIPNVRTLNLDYNFLENLTPLEGLTRLSKLSVVGARLAKARPVANVLSSLVELESVDFRMNPFTLAFYPPLVPTSEGLLPSHAEHRILHPDNLSSSSSPESISDPSTSSKAWQALDTKFRRALPDEWYHKRAAYRAVVLQSAPALARLDGIDCARERPKLTRRLEKLAKKQQGARQP